MIFHVLSHKQWRSHWGGKGGRVPPPDSEKFTKNREKSGKIGGKSGKKEEKSGKKRQKLGNFFHFAPPDR